MQALLQLLLAELCFKGTTLLNREGVARGKQPAKVVQLHLQVLEESEEGERESEKL